MCGYVGARAWTVRNRAWREGVHLTAEEYRLRPMVPVYILDKELSSIQILHDVYNALVANVRVFDSPYLRRPLRRKHHGLRSPFHAPVGGRFAVCERLIPARLRPNLFWLEVNCSWVERIDNAHQCGQRAGPNAIVSALTVAAGSSGWSFAGDIHPPSWQDSVVGTT
jgi:hypothetical protein